MSSLVTMPGFSDDPTQRVKVTRVFRHKGFDVGPCEPLIEVEIGRCCHMTVGATRDGTIYAMHARVGNSIAAGDKIAEIGDAPAPFLRAVFIAYRQADALGYAGRLFDGIVHDFGRAQVFRDIGSLQPGRDFVEQVGKAMQVARVMVLVIGPYWAGASDLFGNRRLESPDDLHRIEIRTALERRIPIVPVLVGRATMPTRKQLPDDIRAVARMQAIEVSDHRWDDDVQLLAKSVANLLREEARTPIDPTIR